VHPAPPLRFPLGIKKQPEGCLFLLGNRPPLGGFLPPRSGPGCSLAANILFALPRSARRSQPSIPLGDKKKQPSGCFFLSPRAVYMDNNFIIFILCPTKTL
jgi:hypothetical protein